MRKNTRKLNTAKGIITFPTYIPVTTFGKQYPLDNLIHPYLPRLSSAVMVSFHYAKEMQERPSIPLLIDSGGFASLFENTKIIKNNGIGILETKTEEGTEQRHPMEVLDFQERNADVAFTLDFIIAPGTNRRETHNRMDLTIANALWAIQNRRRKDMPLYACIQAWDAESARECAAIYANQGFDGIAIGGLVPRAKDKQLILSMVDAVRAEISDLPLHVFGLGNPETTDDLFRAGVDSVDSSSYVRMAVEGRLWGDPQFQVNNPSTTDRLHIAICNLALASGKALPLSASRIHFSTHCLNSRKGSASVGEY